MSFSGELPEARVRRLIEAARRIADEHDPLGRRAQERLPSSTGLSPEGVRLGLARSLELHPSDDEIQALCRAVPSAVRAHVLLSANVFVGALRAIALGLACSHHVEVRASRRDPEMAALLHEASGGLFRLVEELAPLPGEHVWAFGSDATLEALRGDLPGGVVLHGYGSGMGLAVVQSSEQGADPQEQARAAALAIADDVVLFDQRGCLSPRLVLVLGDAELTVTLAQALAERLSELELSVPRGEMTESEAADEVVYRDTMLYVSGLLPAGKGWVSVDTEPERLLLPPVGRNVHVARVSDLASLAVFADRTTAVGLGGPPDLAAQVRQQLPRARLSELGKMQQPRFDGPVDLRVPLSGEAL